MDMGKPFVAHEKAPAVVLSQATARPTIQWFR